MRTCRLTGVTLYYSFPGNVKCCSMNTYMNTQRGGSQCVIYGVESARLGEFRKPEVRCDTLLAAQLEHVTLHALQHYRACGKTLYITQLDNNTS